MESADEALTAFAAARSDAAVPHRYLESWNANLSGATDDADSLHAAITAQLERDPATFGPADWARLRAYVAADAETGLVGLEQTLDDGSSALQKLDQLTVGSSPLDSDTSQLLTSWQLRAGRVADDPDRLRSLVASQISGDVADYSAHDWQRLRTLVGLDPTVDQTRLATSIDGIDDVDTILGAASNGGSFRQGDAERYVDLWRLQLEAPSAAAVAAQMDELGGRAADTLTTNDWRRARALLDLDATTDTGRFVRDIDGLVSAEDSLTSLVDGSRTVGGTARRYMSIWAAEARGVTRSSRQLTNELRSVLDGAEPESIDDWIRLRTLFEIDQQRSSPKLTGALTDSPVARELLEQLGDGTVQQIDDMRRYLKTWQYALDGTTASGDKTRAALNEVLARQTGEFSPDELRRLRVLVDGDAARSELGLARRLDGATAATDLLAPKGDAEAAKAVPDLDRYTELWRSQLAGTADDETHLRGIVEPLLARGIDQLDETELRALRGVLDADQASGRLGLLRQLDGTTPPVPQLTSRIATPDASLGSLERYARTWASQLDGSATDRDALARSLSTLVSDLHAGGLDDEGRRALQALVDIDAATGTLGLARSVGKLPAVDQLLASTSLDPNHMRRYADVWTAQVDGIASTRGRLAPRLDALLSRESADLTPEDWSTLRHLVDVDAAGGGVGLGRKLPFEKDAATLLDGTVDGKGVHATLERYLAAWRMQLDGSATDRDAMARRVIELVERNPDALAVDEVPKLRALLDADSLTHVLGLKRPNVNSDQLGTNFAKASQGTTTSELGRSLELWDLQARGILGDVAASRTELLRLVDRAPAEITARNWARAAALLDPDHGGRALGLSRELPGLASAQKLATLGSDGNAVDETTARSFASIWKYQVDGTLADPIAFKTELTRLLDVPSGERTADEWIKLIALVDADRQQLHVGLTQLPESTVRANSDKLIMPGSTSAQGMAGYEQIWRHELDGTFQDADRLRKLVASITAQAHPPREDWIMLDHVLEMDAHSGVLGLTRRASIDTDYVAATRQMASAAGSLEPSTRQLMFGQWRTDIGTGYALSESQALQNGRLAAHMIRRADVDGFLADSAVKQTAFHGSTNAETHAHIIEKGPLVDKNKRSAFGRGFYTATEPGGWGDDIVEVAIDTRRPLIVDNTDHLSSWVSSHGGGDKRDAVLRSGYDSIVYRNGDGVGGDWLIGLKDDAIKIVVEDAPGTFDERGILPTKLDWGSLT
jgi:hypothetical protein